GGGGLVHGGGVRARRIGGHQPDQAPPAQDAARPGVVWRDGCDGSPRWKDPADRGGHAVTVHLPRASAPDPLAVALRRKAARDEQGVNTSTIVAAGDGWRVVDMVCTSGPADRPFEERQSAVTISLVLAGTFVYRTDRGSSLMSPGAFVLGNVGAAFECSHEHGEGDRCLSFQFETALFERLAHDAGAARPAFER